MPLALVEKIHFFGFDLSVHFIPAIIWILGIFISACRFLSSDYQIRKFSITFVLMLLILSLTPLIMYRDVSDVFVSIFFWVMLLSYFDPCRLEIERYFGYKSFLNLIILIFALAILQLNVPLFDPNITGSDVYFMNDNGTYRATSVFLNPNSFGYWISLFFIILVCQFIVYNLNFRLFIILIVVLYLLYETGSRSSWISCLLVLLYGFFYFYRKELMVKFGLLFLLAIFQSLLFSLFVPESLHDIDVRIEKWSLGFSIWSNSINSILFGVSNSVNIESDGLAFSDNMLLYFLYRYGLLYFSIFLCAWSYIIINSASILKSSNKNWMRFAICSTPLLYTPMLFLSDAILFFPVSFVYAFCIAKSVK